jgi:DegV family protein with EDD domain
MNRIGIVTEDTADFPSELIDRYGIAIVPTVLTWPELAAQAGDNTFQKMRELEKKGIKSFGKTSQPSPREYLDKYRTQLQKFGQVLCITITSKLSGSYNSAVLARNLLTPEEQSRVMVVDSLSASCGQALVALRAIDLIAAGMELDAVARKVEELVPHVRVFVMFADPKWMEASGRISRMVANLMRGMARLGVRPVLAFEKGALVPSSLKSRAADTAVVLFKQIEIDTGKARKAGKRIRIVITHGDDLEEANRLKEMAEKQQWNIEVSFVNLINDVVGGITGPDTLAVAWCEA